MSHCMAVKIGSDKGLYLYGSSPSAELMMSYHQMALISFHLKIKVVIKDDTFKIPSVKWRPFCSGRNALTTNS